MCKHNILIGYISDYLGIVFPSILLQKIIFSCSVKKIKKYSLLLKCGLRRNNRPQAGCKRVILSRERVSTQHRELDTCC